MKSLEKLDNKEELDIETFKSSFGLVKQNTLHIGNIPYHFEKKDLIDLFKDCGAVIDVRIPQDRGRKKGFAFVTLENDKAARKALNYDGHKPMQRHGRDNGKPLRVSIAQSEGENRRLERKDERPKRRSRSRSYERRRSGRRRSSSRSRSPPSRSRNDKKRDHHRRRHSSSESNRKRRHSKKKSHRRRDYSSHSSDFLSDEDR